MNRPIDSQNLRIPPQALEAEMSLLGGLMLNNSKFDDISAIVRQDDFYSQNHRLIFKAIADLVAGGDGADLLTVSEYLEKRDQLEKAGGFSYLGSMANNTPSAANVHTYAKIVAEKSVLRQIISAAMEISDKAYSDDESKSVLSEADVLFSKISDSKVAGGLRLISETLPATIDDVEHRFEHQDEILGVPTGLKDLDAMTCGLHKGEMIILAARPSVGKTSLAMNIAEHVGIDQGLSVGVFSLEMPIIQLNHRLISSVGRIDSSRIRSGKLTEDDWPRFNAAVGKLDKSKIYLDDCVGLSPSDIAARVRKVHRDQKLDLVVIDYLGLMESDVPTENETTRISHISTSIKNTAKQLDIPILVLSQLNRSVENRPNKRPVNSDLRQSGAIEQDADVILFLYRDEVYNEDTEAKGIAEIIIGKQRNGPIGTVKCAFRKELTRFENIARGYQ